MKTIFTAFLLLFGIGAFAQDPMYSGQRSIPINDSRLHLQPLPINNSTGKIEFHNMVEVPGKSMPEIHAIAREWFLKTFASPNAALETDDIDAGVLKGKGVITKTMFSSTTGLFGDMESANLTVKVDSDDGYYSYTLSDIVFNLASPQATRQYPAEEIITDKHLFKPNGQARSKSRNLKEMVMISVRQLTNSLKSSIKNGEMDNY
ncbi:DUF4468 domain-containing protein [Pontibacter sp. 13R65]|uniref:DUF4468 domain-containing protein n=1 Tax=Pontibacter sp. 13R65 TaxID=3127458 RepID=UPI00301BD1EE